MNINRKKTYFAEPQIGVLSGNFMANAMFYSSAITSLYTHIASLPPSHWNMRNYRDLLIQNLKLMRDKAKNLALVTFFLLFFAGCELKKSVDSGGLKKFNDTILSLRQNDGFLSKEDMDSLKKIVLEQK